MTSKNLYRCLGGLDPEIIAKAAPAEKTHKRPAWVKWAAMAACACLLAGVAFRVAMAFVPSQLTDPFREGTLMEITGQDELPTQYDGELLAFRLNFDGYEFYFKKDGCAENTEDWYSLLGLGYSEDGRILLHCMFGDTTVEDWKVKRVFTKKATETVHINGVEVQIAPHELSLNYAYWHYAIFEYDDVVYDLRVQSNEPEYVYEVLHTLLGAPLTE